jgi:hypothetical protein
MSRQKGIDPSLSEGKTRLSGPSRVTSRMNLSAFLLEAGSVGEHQIVETEVVLMPVAVVAGALEGSVPISAGALPA